MQKAEFCVRSGIFLRHLQDEETPSRKIPPNGKAAKWKAKRRFCQHGCHARIGRSNFGGISIIALV